MLAFAGQDFAQLIEGPRDAVDHLWSRIRADGRHCDIVVLQDELMDARWCGDWRIGFPLAPAITGRIAALRSALGLYDGFATADFLRLLNACDPQ